VSLNLISTEPDVLEFTGLQVYNALGDGGQKRFETVFDSAEGLLPNAQQACFAAGDEEGFWEFKGFSVTPDSTVVGMGPGSTLTDPRYDAAQDAWLLATATFDITALGQTELFLQIGAAGINHLGQSTDLTSVVLGGADPPLNAKTQRCLSSSSLDATMRGVLAGDFDLNGLLQAADIDLLSTATRSGVLNLNFDLDQNELVNHEDRRVWVEQLFGTLFGDADLNKTVAFADFVALSGSFGGAAGWAQGDFDGDGTATFGDFVILAANFGQSAAPNPAVPEPAGLGLASVSLIWLLICRKQFPLARAC
jgi:hypothetical protein